MSEVKVIYKCKRCGKEYGTRKEAVACGAQRLDKYFKPGDLIVLVDRYGPGYLRKLRKIRHVDQFNLAADRCGLARVAFGEVKNPKDVEALSFHLCAWRYKKIDNTEIDRLVDDLDRRLSAAKKLQTLIHAQNEGASK